jgi:hypothetical protein
MCSKKDVPLLPFSEVLGAKWGLRCACAQAKKLNSGLGFNSNNFTTWTQIHFTRDSETFSQDTPKPNLKPEPADTERPMLDWYLFDFIDKHQSQFFFEKELN